MHISEVFGPLVRLILLCFILRLWLVHQKVLIVFARISDCQVSLMIQLPGALIEV